MDDSPRFPVAHARLHQDIAPRDPPSSDRWLPAPLVEPLTCRRGQPTARRQPVSDERNNVCLPALKGLGTGKQVDAGSALRATIAYRLNSRSKGKWWPRRMRRSWLAKAHLL